MTYVAASRLWWCAWLAAGAFTLWNPAGGALEARRAQLPKVLAETEVPRVTGQVSWWPNVAVVRSEPVAEVLPAKAAAPVPVVEVKLPRLPEEPAMPNVQDVQSWATGAELDPKAAQLEVLKRERPWGEDTRLTVVAIYIRCPDGPGMCLVEDSLVLQSNQTDMRRLLTAFARGAKINLAPEDRAKMKDTGAGWVLRSFRVASSEELLP